MTNIVMAIALWCGSPKVTDTWETALIDKCRKELFVCVEKSDTNGKDFDNCFKNKKLND
jgi:hypothetical protein